MTDTRFQEIITRVLEEVRSMPTPCWLWTGSDSGNGYGRVSIGGKTRAVHIVVYEHHKGPVPEGMVLDHECRNRECCNPDHLTPRTVLDNTLRGIGPTARNAAKTHCKRGHALKGDNLMLRERGGRIHRECRACKKIRSIPWRKRLCKTLAAEAPCEECGGSGAWDKVAKSRDNRAMECSCRECSGTGVRSDRQAEAWAVLLFRHDSPRPTPEPGRASAHQ